MRRACCIFFFLCLALWAQAQPFSLYSYSQGVQIVDKEGKERTLRVGMDISRNDRVTVPRQSSLCIHDGKDNSVLVVGACPGRTVAELVKSRKNGFLGRMVSMLTGADASDRAYVSYKGENPVPEFVFASHQDAYRSSYDIELRVLDAGTGEEAVSSLHDGQQVYFEVVNREPFPLCIGILWRDSQGGLVDCLADAGRYVLVPAEGSLDLSDYMMEVTPPLGRDAIFLFAATDFFDLGSFARVDAESRPEQSSGEPVGFVKKQYSIQ